MSEQTLTTGKSSVGEHTGAFQVHAETLTFPTQERVQLIDITPRLAACAFNQARKMILAGSDLGDPKNGLFQGVARRIA